MATYQERNPLEPNLRQPNLRQPNSGRPIPDGQIPDTMTAIVVSDAGRPPTLELAARPTPVPAAGEALLRVDACGFCHHDYLVMAGTLRRGVMPGVALGHEIAGAVMSVADDVGTLQPGDRVVSLLTAACGRCVRCRSGREHRCIDGSGIGHGRDGGFAEYVALPAAALVPIPRHLPAESAALLACPAGVALEGLGAVDVCAGETVVITGAGGGLGAHAVQAAAMLGALVIAVTTSPDKMDALETLGATHVIPADDDLDFAELVMALTDDAGADAVIDTVGPPLWPSTLRCLGQYGRLALLGDLTGEEVSIRLAETIFRDLRIIGHSGVSRATLERAVAMAAAGELRPVVAQTLPLTPEGALDAWRMVAERKPLGRLALARQDHGSTSSP